MKKTRWIGPVSLTRLSRIMELAGHRPYHTNEGAYVLNLLDFYPHDRNLVLAAIEQATNKALADSDLVVPDAVDLRNARARPGKPLSQAEYQALMAQLKRENEEFIQVAASMQGDDFETWAMQRYGMSYDAVAWADMQREVNTKLPAELQAVLAIRKASRPPSKPSGATVQDRDFESEWVDRGSTDGE